MANVFISHGIKVPNNVNLKYSEVLGEYKEVKKEKALLTKQIGFFGAILNMLFPKVQESKIPCTWVENDEDYLSLLDLKYLYEQEAHSGFLLESIFDLGITLYSNFRRISKRFKSLRSLIKCFVYYCLNHNFLFKLINKFFIRIHSKMISDKSGNEDNSFSPTCDMKLLFNNLNHYNNGKETYRELYQRYRWCN